MAQEHAPHRVMRLAATRGIHGAALERLLRDRPGRLQVAEHEAKRDCDPQPADGHLAAPIGSRQREHAIEILLDFDRGIPATGVQRDGQAGAQRQLLLVAIPSGRQPLDDRQRMRQAADCFLGCRQAGGDGGGPFEKRNGTSRLTAAIEMSGNRRAHIVEAIGKEKLHRPGRSADGSDAGAPVRCRCTPLRGCGRG